MEEETKVKLNSVNESPTIDIVIPEAPSSRKPAVTRRSDIDFLRILVVWLILLYHTVDIYIPYAKYYIKDYGPGGIFGLSFFISMNVWNIPMFFFLSGASVYFALFRRTELKFREERLHRLLVPAFTLAVTSLTYCLIFFAPLAWNCKQYYQGVKDFNSTLPYKDCEMFYKFTKNDSFKDFMRRIYLPFASPHQGWFLIYLFTFSQLLATWFCTFHPNHNGDEVSGPDCCGQKTSCCSKPFSLATKIFGCFHFFCKPASTPTEFVDAVCWWLGSCVKLAVFPSLWIGVVEALLRHFFPDGNLGMFSVFYDLCNDVKYIFVFILGYALAAADGHGLKEVIKKGKWWYFVSGTITLFVYTGFVMYLHSLLLLPLYLLIKGLLRGFAEWLFILGCYGVCRDIITKPYHWISVLSVIAMPYYLTHQQVLISLASGMLWLPILSSFPVLLISSTLVTFAISFIITKAGPIKYFFGLPSTLLPGKKLKGLLPLWCLITLYLIAVALANAL